MMANSIQWVKSAHGKVAVRADRIIAARVVRETMVDAALWRLEVVVDHGSATTTEPLCTGHSEDTEERIAGWLIRELGIRGRDTVDGVIELVSDDEAEDNRTHLWWTPLDGTTQS
jgi:hypothetical protein